MENFLLLNITEIEFEVFNSIPTSPTEKPDWALMADKPTDYPLLDDFIIQNPIIDSNANAVCLF